MELVSCNANVVRDSGGRHPASARAQLHLVASDGQLVSGSAPTTDAGHPGRSPAALSSRSAQVELRDRVTALAELADAVEHLAPTTVARGELVRLLYQELAEVDAVARDVLAAHRDGQGR